MTYRDLLNIFKQRYPGIDVHDYRPAVKMHIPNHLPGIVIWTEQGDLIVFYLQENELEKLTSCPFEEPVGKYQIVQQEKRRTRFDKITESPSALAYFIRDIGCNVGHYQYPDGFPPYSNPEEMEAWLKQEVIK